MNGYTRNSDLTYYETHKFDANCGSYALRLNEWYELDDSFENVTGWYIDEWIVAKCEEGYEDFEISTMYGDILVECMLQEFGDELEVCDGKAPSASNIELIAFSTFCYGGNGDFDFHFKVFRDNKWMEKCGTDEVRECSIEDWGNYIGNVTYFYHKIGGLND